MQTERVLVVDDDPVILMLCQRILEADGYQVVAVKRGEDALARLDAEPFDVLLTDIRLPGLDGLEVTTRLRERGLEMVVITMTGYSNMEMAIHALSLGVDEFIIKPFTPDMLRVHFNRALEKANLRRENLRLKTLLPLLQSSHTIAAAPSTEQVFYALCQVVNAQLQIDNAAVLSFDANADTFTVAAAIGEHMTMWNGQTWSLQELVEPEKFSSGDMLVWNQRAQPRLPMADGVEWLTAVPLLMHHNLLGMLLVETPPLSESDADYLHLLAAHASLAIENAHLLDQVGQAYARLRELDHVKNEFIHLARQQLRAPLAAIVQNAQLLSERADLPARECADAIVQDAARLNRIADEMLTLKALEPEQAELHPEACDVARAIYDVVSAYEKTAETKTQRIQVNVSSEIGQVMADRAMLQLILGSMLSNALEISPREGQVRVSAEGDSETVTVSVYDSGKALEPEQAARIFDPLYAASNVFARNQNGMGLGLTWTREMVHAHGGKIWVESYARQGNVFYVMLPRNFRPNRLADA